MGYHPFGAEDPRKLRPKDPKMQPYPRMAGGTRGMRDEDEGGQMTVDPDFLPQDEEVDAPIRMNPEAVLREQLEQLEHVNSDLQDEHTRLETNIKKLHNEAERLFGQKMRVEGQIEMVQVTHRQTTEQLRLFQDRGQD